MSLKSFALAAALAVGNCPAMAQDLGASVSAAAHAACRVAADSVAAMMPGLRQAHRDNEAAQALLAEAMGRLRLASAPLSNSDCAGAGFGTPECARLDEAYRLAREEVLVVEAGAQSAARTYAVGVARYQSAASAATRLCASAVKADAMRAQGSVADSDLVSFLQDLLTQTTDLIAALDPGVDDAVPVVAAPPPPVAVDVPVPPPPTVAVAPTDPTTGVTMVGGQEAYLTWGWQFSAIAYNGTLTGNVRSKFTFDGTSIPGADGRVGTAHCTGTNVPAEGWEEGAAQMDCTATWPASATARAESWRATGGGLANYDGFLVKGLGRGSITYSDGQVYESGADSYSLRAGRAP